MGWDIGSGDVDDVLKATGVAISEMGFKEGNKAEEEDLCADTVDLEVLKAQEVKPWAEHNICVMALSVWPTCMEIWNW